MHGIEGLMIIIDKIFDQAIGKSKNRIVEWILTIILILFVIIFWGAILLIGYGAFFLGVN